MIRSLLLSGFFIAASASAGIPVDQEIECPIGDEIITITSTLSCSSVGPVMNLTRPSSCDFVTRIPDCTEMGLPLYRPFDDDELAELETYLLSDAFETLRGESRFTRAYHIERHLRPDGPHADALYVLLEAYEEDPKTTANGDMMGLAEKTTERLLAADTPGVEALLGTATVAAWHAYAGREDLAVDWLGKLEALAPTVIKDAENALAKSEEESDAHNEGEDQLGAATFFAEYGERLRNCLGSLEDEGCRANDYVYPLR